MKKGASGFCILHSDGTGVGQLLNLNFVENGARRLRRLIVSNSAA
jgi:hypothetical protein